MQVLITLTTAGTDTGPFDLYSDTDGYTTPFETGLTRAALVAGYTSSLVPNGSTEILVRSTGVCARDLYLPITGSPTTTSTSTSSTTSTSTTPTPSTPISVNNQKASAITQFTLAVNSTNVSGLTFMTLPVGTTTGIESPAPPTGSLPYTMVNSSSIPMNIISVVDSITSLPVTFTASGTNPVTGNITLTSGNLVNGITFNIN